MNINNLSGAVGNTSVSSVGGVSAVGSSTPSSIPPPMGGAASASISTPGQFLSGMQQLSQQNPTEFKTIASQVATSFQNAAAKTSGAQAQFLSALANQFSQAAQTGTLQPPSGVSAAQGVSGAAQAGGAAGAHHHHHRHYGGGGAVTQSSEVQQAFASATDIFNQVTQGATGSTSSTSALSSTST